MCLYTFSRKQQYAAVYGANSSHTKDIIACRDSQLTDTILYTQSQSSLTGLIMFQMINDTTIDITMQGLRRKRYKSQFLSHHITCAWLYMLLVINVAFQKVSEQHVWVVLPHPHPVVCPLLYSYVQNNHHKTITTKGGDITLPPLSIQLSLQSLDLSTHMQFELFLIQSSSIASWLQLGKSAKKSDKQQNNMPANNILLQCGCRQGDLQESLNVRVRVQILVYIYTVQECGYV